MRQRVKLKAISFEQDFRYNEFTIYNTFRKSRQFPGELKPGEVFLFVSRMGNQLLWVLNVANINAVGSKQSIIDTRRWRLSGSYWNHMMLADYAENVGIDLVGIRKFADHFA